MDHLLKWTSFWSRVHLAPDDGGGAASATPAPSGGDTGGGSVPSSSPAGGDAPAASPGSSPAPDTVATPAASPATPAQPTDPWGNLGSADDLDHVELAPIPPVIPPVVEPTAAPPPGATAPASPAAQTQPAAPQQDPAQTPQAQAATPPQPNLSPSDPAGIASAMEANRNEIIAHLATTKFALSPEDIQEIETDVVTALPKFMSRVFLESQMAAQRFLAQSVPGMVQNYNKVSQANNDAESKFFEAHKALGLSKDNPQHRAAATRIASIYRQANPGIALDQLIQEVGPMVAAAVKASGQPVAPAATPTPQQPRGGTPFRPAVNGGGGVTGQPAPIAPWEGLGMNFDES